MPADKKVTPAVAKAMIAEGSAPDGLAVSGTLDLSDLDKPFQLPSGLTCFELIASGTQIEKLPNINVEFAITLDNCHLLTSLPQGLKTGTLSIRNCGSLTALPEGLDVWYLDASGCSALSTLPNTGTLGRGDVNFSGCSNLTQFPNSMGPVSTLNLSDCSGIVGLPEKLRINLWIDIGGSGLVSLSESQRQIGLRWRGVPLDYETAFHPKSIRVEKVLQESNTEKRRVLIERMGYDRFMTEAKAERLDKDTDPGGERELLKVKLTGDEDMVCLSCFCPSTQRHYFLRVPPATQTCHQAAAWMAGFDDPAKYKPVIET